MVCCARRFAEVAWRSYGKTDNWRNSPRFKLANATRTPDRALDVKMTGFAFLPPNRSASQLRQDLLKAYGIKMARPEPATGKASQYLSVVGNGWAGSSTRNALLSGGCMLAIPGFVISHGNSESISLSLSLHISCETKFHFSERV